MTPHNAIDKQNIADKFLGCIMGGALGDALGAPLEGIFDFKSLHEQYGDHGLSNMIEFKDFWGDRASEEGRKGLITDDTTMLATTLESMNIAVKAQAQENSLTGLNLDRLMHLTWQGYLNWGSYQSDGEDLRAFIDPAIKWSQNIQNLWFQCGAGRSTISALRKGRKGTPEAPVTYDRVIRGKRTQGLNDGCGGMMRVAPLAFFNINAKEAFNLARHNAAITHGAEEATLAAGSIAFLTSHAKKTGTPHEGLNELETHLKTVNTPGAALCLNALYEAKTAITNAEPNTSAINALPATLGFKNASKFKAIPVLAQTAYALHASDRIDGAHEDKFKRALALAVTHSGDSDSVGAITGNILVAAWGQKSLPQEWLNDIQKRDHLAQLVKTALHLELPYKSMEIV